MTRCGAQAPMNVATSSARVVFLVLAQAKEIARVTPSEVATLRQHREQPA